MWRELLIVSSLTFTALAIRVPVYGMDDNDTTTDVKPLAATPKDEKEVQTPTGIYYVPDNVNIDSYLIPPNPHVPEEVLPDYIVTPATYLLPPSLDKQINYYAPSTENGKQTDWYPMQQESYGAPKIPSLIKVLPPSSPVVLLETNRTFGIVENPRHGKLYDEDRYVSGIPSRQLEPPIESSPSDFEIPIPSKDLELPSPDTSDQLNHKFYSDDKPSHKQKPKFKTFFKKDQKREDFLLQPVEPTLALHLTPPKPHVNKIPTNLYPKKVVKGFQPIPIPIAQFVEETPDDVPLAKPIKPFNPGTGVENEYFTSPEEKKLYLYQQAEQKRKLKHENDAIKKQQSVVAAEDTYGDDVSAEPETSETNYRHPGRNVYPAPLRKPPPSAPAPHDAYAQAPAERTEFRMHGMKGPHSYQFGYDTGKGKNRQFRYEERDNEGRVKGHYGYVDRDGKLRVVNYDADPEHGFHAESPKEAE